MQDSRLNAMSVKRKFPVGLGKTRACGNCAISVGPHILINFRSLPVFGHKLLVLDCYLVCSSLKLRAATALTKKIVHASALTSRAQPASFPCSSPFFDSIFLFTFQFFNLYRFSFFFFLSVCLSLFTDVSLLSLSLSLLLLLLLWLLLLLFLHVLLHLRLRVFRKARAIRKRRGSATNHSAARKPTIYKSLTVNFPFLPRLWHGLMVTLSLSLFFSSFLFFWLSIDISRSRWVPFVGVDCTWTRAWWP